METTMQLVDTTGKDWTSAGRRGERGGGKDLEAGAGRKLVRDSRTTTNEKGKGESVRKIERRGSNF